MMHFYPNWKEIAKRSWSLRFIILAGFLSGGNNTSGHMVNYNLFAALSFVAVSAAFRGTPSRTERLVMETKDVKRYGAILASAAALAASFEGLRQYAYYDPRPGDAILTVCYGSTTDVRKERSIALKEIRRLEDQSWSMPSVLLSAAIQTFLITYSSLLLMPYTTSDPKYLI